MPNVCTNTIFIEGNAESIDLIWKMGQSEGHEGRFNFENTLVKTFDLAKCYAVPEELLYIHCGSTTINGERFDNWKYVDKTTGEVVHYSILNGEDDNIEMVGLTEEEVDELKEKYGSANAYDWTYANWDTKWITEVSINNVRFDEYKPDNYKSMEFEVDTAWSPPVALLQHLCDCYDLKINCRWWEEGGSTGWEHLYPNN